MTPYGESVPRQAQGRLWCPKDPVGTYDDEFTADTIAAGTWAQTGTWSAATPPDPFAAFAAGNIRYSIGRSWLKIQPPADGVLYMLHKQLGGGLLPDGTYQLGVHSAWRDGSTAGPDASVRLTLSATAAGPPPTPDWTNDSIFCYLYNSAGQRPRASSSGRQGGGGLTTYTITPMDYNVHITDLVIIKDGTLYDCYACGTTGYYVHLGEYNYGGAATIDRVVISVVNTSSATPGNQIVGVDYFRYNNSGMLP